jgi:hypothetical protein
LVSAQAQTPPIEVTADDHQAQFAVQGEGHAMRVEVYAPSGEMVFDSGTVTGQVVEWRMRNQQGERVADGLYLATISTQSGTGKTRKRIEQIVVSRESQANDQAVASSAPEAAITGAGTGTATSGFITKFTGASTIGNSVIVQSATKNIGIGTTTPPAAKLQVNGEPGANSANNGTNATTLLQTSGGKGGNTTGAGKKGGQGASISLVAGDGGNAASNGTNGAGGSITLQPGAAGTGGFGSSHGKVLLAPLGGRVGVGTTSPGQLDQYASTDTKMHVKGDGGSALIAQGTGLTTGVSGISENGYAGSFIGKTQVTGNLEIVGKIGVGTSTPKAKLHVTGGNIFIAKPNSLIITSPNGTCWFITVSDTGALSSFQVTCP